MTQFEDKPLVCKDCNNEFVWTSGEQRFFAEKGFQNPPVRCSDCRKKNKDAKKQKEPTKIICKKCGNEGEVPFEPKNPDDILCSKCFYEEKEAQKNTPAEDKSTEEAPTQEE